MLSAIKKELLEIAHDRTMLAVLLAFPVFVMLLMGSFFQSMEIRGLPIGISGGSNTTFAEVIMSGLNGSGAFNLESFDDESSAMTAFRDGRLRAVILIPADFDREVQEGNGSTVRVIVDNSDLALEQSILAAMSSVIEASSTNITKSYVSSAWGRLDELNSSAAALALQINSSRTQMAKTKESLAEIRSGMDAIGVGALESSIDNASSTLAALKANLDSQKESIGDAQAGNEAFMNSTGLFLANASSALNESISTVGSTHAKLKGQLADLNATVQSLDASIAGLIMIRDSTSDNTTKAALELNIEALQSLRNSTAGQMADVEDEIGELEDLNETLNDFGDSLDDYSEALDEADQDSIGELSLAIDQASDSLADAESSFSLAKAEISKLKGLLQDIDDATDEIDGTLDQALEQTASVDELIKSLQDTVAEQTSKDPNIIASPLSVEVEPQYYGASFVDFIMPQVIAVSLLLSCFLLGAISLVREKTRKTIVRALMLPSGLATLVLGKVLTLMLLSFGQIAIILTVALLLFGVRPPANLPMLVIGTAISSLVLSSIGVLVGFYARTESAAVQSCLLLAIPMLFLGNIMFSPDLLPKYTQLLQQLLPLAHVTSIYKVVLITDGNPTANIAALLSYFILVAIVLGYISFRRRDISSYG